MYLHVYIFTLESLKFFTVTSQPTLQEAVLNYDIVALLLDFFLHRDSITELTVDCHNVPFICLASYVVNLLLN